jgi:hypothetical protein
MPSYLKDNPFAAEQQSSNARHTTLAIGEQLATVERIAREVREQLGMSPLGTIRPEVLARLWVGTSQACDGLEAAALLLTNTGPTEEA